MYMTSHDAWIVCWKQDFANNGVVMEGLEWRKKVGRGVYILFVPEGPYK
jgi:hypothetical protein